MKNLNDNFGTGDIVKIQIINWRENHKTAYAKIVSLVAKSDDPYSEYIWVSQRYGIIKFKDYTVSKSDQNKYKSILESNLKNRKDLSSLRTFTVDPKNAKRF